MALSEQGAASLSRRRRGRAVSLAIGATVLTLLPESIAFQDLGALLARRPAVAKRWQQHLIASPFGTIHAAMFTLPRPVGTAIPHPPIYALANFDPLDITGSIGRQPLGDLTAPLVFPKANRRAKGDSRIERPREPIPPLPSVSGAPSEAEAAQKKDEADGRFEPYAKYEFITAPDERSSTPDVELPYVDLPPANLTPVAPSTAGKDAAQLYFGIDSIAADREGIAPWAPGEAPVVLASRGDPDIKQSALGTARDNGENAGESAANKGEVTGIDQRPRSPAERLALTGVARAKAEKCLANAVYFEARGEAVRGQIAVAQVVMNRVFSPFYPNDVCGVVYQNAHRHNACQFTFACDGVPDIVTEPDAWERAKRIARDMLDGKLWMPEVSKSTHYHAYWVRPDWVGEMKKVYKLGVHTFYRPRAWGDGDDEPTWGDAATTEMQAAAEEAKGPVSHSLEWLKLEQGQASIRQKNARK
ncbi:MAG TPA: cell wall hydrolase [Pseudolabrys sp.]|nr:cell wall hydrolase [Pseudolabrys sp.]